MGLRHISLLTLRDDTTDDQRDAIVTDLRKLPGQIPELRSYVVGTDVGLAEGNATVAIVADFDDVAGYETYRDHPAHKAVATEQILPVLTGRAAIQHDT